MLFWLCSAFIVSILGRLSKSLVLSNRHWGQPGDGSSSGTAGLIFWAVLATGLRLLFDLGFGTGHLGALGFSGQLASSETSKTIKGATLVGTLPGEAAGEG